MSSRRLHPHHHKARQQAVSLTQQYKLDTRFERTLASSVLAPQSATQQLSTGQCQPASGHKHHTCTALCPASRIQRSLWLQEDGGFRCSAA